LSLHRHRHFKLSDLGFKSKLNELEDKDRQTAQSQNQESSKEEPQQQEILSPGPDVYDVDGIQKLEREISTCFAEASAKLDKIDSDANNQKSQIIQLLAIELEDKMATNEIANEIVEQLSRRQKKVFERLVYYCLDEKYKKKYRVENARKRQAKVKSAAILQLKPEIVIDTSGQPTNLEDAPAVEQDMYDAPPSTKVLVSGALVSDKVLNLEQRSSIVKELNYLGYSQTNIAKIMKISPKTVRRDLVRTAPARLTPRGMS
jgi:DNA-directed RNA polymerase specialized sigma24 family protein